MNVSLLDRIDILYASRTDIHEKQNVEEAVKTDQQITILAFKV